MQAISTSGLFDCADTTSCHASRHKYIKERLLQKYEVAKESINIHEFKIFKNRCVRIVILFVLKMLQVVNRITFVEIQVIWMCNRAPCDSLVVICCTSFLSDPEMTPARMVEHNQVRNYCDNSSLTFQMVKSNTRECQIE